MRILRYGLTLLLLSSYCAPVFACDEGSISDCCIFKEAGQKRFTLPPSRINLIELQDKNYYGGFANKVTILTGTKRSPYFEMAEDIAAMMLCDSIAFEAVSTKGSKENIAALLSTNDAKFAIVQWDILQHQYKENSDVKQFVRVVADLHLEEVHLIVRDNIKKWSDLAGKKVFLGNEGSGTLFTAKEILKLKQPIDFDRVTQLANPAKSLELGEVDAIFSVIGAPAGGHIQKVLLADSSGFKLLSTVSENDKPSNYVISTITPDVYEGVKQGTKTYAVNASLVTYRWESKKKNRHFAKVCKITATLYDSLTANLDTLSELSSPRANGTGQSYANENWRKVDLYRFAETGGITPRSECLQRLSF